MKKLLLLAILTTTMLMATNAQASVTSIDFAGDVTTRFTYLGPSPFEGKISGTVDYDTDSMFSIAGVGSGFEITRGFMDLVVTTTQETYQFIFQNGFYDQAESRLFALGEAYSFYGPDVLDLNEFTFTFDSGGGRLAGTVTSPTPLPGAAILLGSGLVGLLGLRRRFQQ